MLVLGRFFYLVRQTGEFPKLIIPQTVAHITVRHVLFVRVFFHFGFIDIFHPSHVCRVATVQKPVVEYQGGRPALVVHHECHVKQLLYLFQKVLYRPFGKYFVPMVRMQRVTDVEFPEHSVFQLVLGQRVPQRVHHLLDVWAQVRLRDVRRVALFNRQFLSFFQPPGVEHIVIGLIYDRCQAIVHLRICILDIIQFLGFGRRNDGLFHLQG